MSETEHIPVCYQPTQALTAKDALAMLSLLVFLLVPMLSALWAVSTFAFGLAPDAPVQTHLHGPRLWLYAGVSALSLVVVVYASKYVWLVVMSRLLSRCHVGPLISWGIPRRISRFDLALLARFYRQ